MTVTWWWLGAAFFAGLIAGLMMSERIYRQRTAFGDQADQERKH